MSPRSPKRSRHCKSASTPYDRWAELTRLPAPDPRLSAATSDFLTTVGLPSAAGLRFHRLGRGLTAQENFLVVGDDSGGNPVCVDLSHGERVVLLDHEGGFAVAAFVNSSVAQLAECIQAFLEMVEAFQQDDEDADLYEGNVPTELVESTLARFRKIDPASVAEDGYWPTALNGI